MEREREREREREMITSHLFSRSIFIWHHNDGGCDNEDSMLPHCYVLCSVYYTCTGYIM